MIIQLHFKRNKMMIDQGLVLWCSASKTFPTISLAKKWHELGEFQLCHIQLICLLLPKIAIGAVESCLIWPQIILWDELKKGFKKNFFNEVPDPPTPMAEKKMKNYLCPMKQILYDIGTLTLGSRLVFSPRTHELCS